MESTEMISPPTFSASASATADLPEAVGPARKMEDAANINVGGEKDPRSKIQDPEKHQAPSSNDTARAFGVWNLELLWILDLGAWCLFGIWDLGFGVGRAVHFAKENGQCHACGENSRAHQLRGRQEAAVNMAGR